MIVVPGHSSDCSTSTQWLLLFSPSVFVFVCVVSADGDWGSSACQPS